MDIQVGDRVTYKDNNGKECIIIVQQDKGELGDEDNTIKEILKIERPTYELIEEKKELLTEEEKEFLKSYIKIIKSLNNGQIKYIARYGTIITIYLKTKLTYDADIGPRFKGMTENETYTLEELGIN